MHMLAAQGYCVVAIDSRGSQHRGLAFEGHLKGRMVISSSENYDEILTNKFNLQPHLAKELKSMTTIFSLLDLPLVFSLPRALKVQIPRIAIYIIHPLAT